MSARHLVRLLSVPVALISLAGPVADGAAAATGPQAGGPQIGVRPSGGLQDGQRVSVRGRGFTPGATIVVVECVSPAGEAGNCDPTTAVHVTASATGSFEANIRVIDHIFTVTHEDTFCTLAPGSCAVVATADKNLLESDQVPLAFIA